MPKRELLNFTKQKFKNFIENILGEPSYRASQLFRWIYQKGISDFSQMTDLGKALREELNTLFTITPFTIKRVFTARDGTLKFLFSLPGGDEIETVLMFYENRITICVSSQVGCPVGCKFCATGMSGFRRNLATYEIVGQIFFAQKYIGKKITNVVFMGMGEPLLNYKNVIDAIYIINDKEGYNIGQRRMTLSTIGIIEGIKELSKEKVKPNLAFSIHAPSDKIRDKIVPINKTHPLSQIIPTLLEYRKITHRKITLEYVIIKNVNDSPESAERLRQIARKLRAKVNIIPLNPVSGLGFYPPRDDSIEKFAKIVEKSVEVSIRKSKGREIQAACGQLRAEYRLRREALHG